MSASNEPKLLFTCDFDERTAFDVELKGWFEAAFVRLPNGVEIPLAFRDTARLAQDLEVEVASGRYCIAEPVLIVVPRVTKDYMSAAVRQLFEEGFFHKLIAIGLNPKA